MRVGKAGEGEHLFFDALKLLSPANPNVFIEAISESILSLGPALLALFSKPVHRVKKQVLTFSCRSFPYN